MHYVTRVCPGWDRNWRCKNKTKQNKTRKDNIHAWENRGAQAAADFCLKVPLIHHHSLCWERNGSDISEKKEFCRKSGDLSLLYQGHLLCPWVNHVTSLGLLSCI
jgi:hypothetical protein